MRFSIIHNHIFARYTTASKLLPLLVLCTTQHRVICGMEWRSHGKNNADLVFQLKKNQVLKSERVEQAMLKVDRGHYTDRNPYEDRPQGIGYAATISAPHMHVHALQHLEDQLQEGMTALDVGSGSGYLTACMSYMVGDTGRVIGIDHIDTLVDRSVTNMRKGNAELLDSGRVELVTGDGRQGYASVAPFDAIHVGAAAPTLPEELIRQLKPGGRMIIPVGPDGGSQALEQYDKHPDGHVTKTKLMGVIYVPLTDRERQWPSRDGL